MKLRRDRPAGRRDARVRRPRADRQARYAKGFFHEPTIFADVDAGDAHRAGRDLRSGGLGDPVPVVRRSGRDRQRRAVRAVGVDLHAGRQPRVRGDARHRTPASSTSTRRPSAPRSTCRSAAPRRPATAIAKRAPRRSTCSPSGSRSTWTSAASSSARRSTPRSYERRHETEPDPDMNWALVGLVYAGAMRRRRLRARRPRRRAPADRQRRAADSADRAHPRDRSARRGHWRGRQAVFWGAIVAWPILWLIGQVGWSIDEAAPLGPAPVVQMAHHPAAVRVGVAAHRARRLAAPAARSARVR